MTGGMHGLRNVCLGFEWSLYWKHFVGSISGFEAVSSYCLICNLNNLFQYHSVAGYTKHTVGIVIIYIYIYVC